MKKVLCKIFGHKCDPIHAEYYGYFHCERCGEELESDIHWIEVATWKSRIWLRDRTRPLLEWLKCKDCGWRFGRHDPDNEHLPF